ncbi:MAG: JAB domain-containing protein [Chloroflexi bacterium]|nr:JAB domain-containing protein [Chloroflexota bacterium]
MTTAHQPPLIPSTDDPERQALLDALRQNLRVLGELAIRYEVETRPERPPDMPTIYRLETVVDLLGEEMTQLAQEQVRVLLLDRKNRVVGQRTIYQGNGYTALVRPAEVFRPAVVEAAPHIVLVHNHPSGDAEPSRDDIKLTRDLTEVGNLLGIELLDHVVIGADGWVSIKQQGLA